MKACRENLEESTHLKKASQTVLNIKIFMMSWLLWPNGLLFCSFAFPNLPFSYFSFAQLTRETP